MRFRCQGFWSLGLFQALWAAGDDMNLGFRVWVYLESPLYFLFWLTNFTVRILYYNLGCPKIGTTIETIGRV